MEEHPIKGSSMDGCKHQHLILPRAPGKKLRCRYCHLSIDEKDLAEGHCPECYEISGVKRKDFEIIDTPNDQKRRYLCESCGAVIMT
jgi:hypothetical protein